MNILTSLEFSLTCSPAPSLPSLLPELILLLSPWKVSVRKTLCMLSWHNVSLFRCPSFPISQISLDIANDQSNSIKPSRHCFFFVQLLRKSSSPRFQSLAWTSRPTCSAFLLTFSRRKSQPLLLLSTISLSDFQRNHQVLKICTISKRGLEIMLFFGNHI